MGGASITGRGRPVFSCDQPSLPHAQYAEQSGEFQTLRAAKGFKMVEVLLSETENRIEYIEDHHSQVAGGQQNRIAGGGWHW